MKMIIAIIHDRDKPKLTARLLENGFAFTKLGSTGGFLREGNHTILVGVENEQLERALQIFQSCCHVCERLMNLPPEAVPAMMTGSIPAQSVQARAGGAVVFVFDVDRFERY